MMTEEYVKPKKRLTKKESVVDEKEEVVVETPATAPVPKNFPLSAPNSSLAQRN